MNTKTDCAIITRYLTGRAPTALTIELFERVAEMNGATDDRWKKCMRHPWLLPWVDAALAWRAPASPFRIQMVRYAAVLECIPEYSDLFLPKQRSPFYVVAIAAQGVWAGSKALIGCLFLPFI